MTETEPDSSVPGSDATEQTHFASANTGPKPLSCKRCRLRKIRCDRDHPCSACQRLGMECAYPGRVRTRKDTKKHNELLSRIARLESLVSGTTEDKAQNSPAPFHSSDVSVETVLAREHYEPQPFEIGREGFWVAETDRPSRYPLNPGPHKSNETHHSSNQFWTSLTAEVDGLKQLLDEASEDDDDEYEDSRPSPSSAINTQPNPTLFFHVSSTYVNLRACHPSQSHAATLCDLYFSRVDPLFKILHKPTVKSSILARAQNLNSLYTERSLEALMFAVYFAAVTSLSSHECIKHFGQSKDVLYDRYRLAVTNSLNNANFLDDVDFVSLQAFMIFLLCFRFGRDKRLAWTLFSLAVRVATALGLHREGSTSIFTPFETEMRRRLWWQICIHDIWQSEDRGLDPMIHEVAFNTLKPANINDEDLDPSDMHPITSKNKGTIMAFSLIGYEVYSLHSKLHYAPPPRVQHDHNCLNWQKKVDLAKQFYLRLNSINQHCDLSDSFQWMCSKLAQVIKAEVFLVLYFPLQSLDNTSPPPVNKEIVLSNGVTFLELLEELETSEHTVLWWWNFRSWVQWHALAVTLAVLCRQPRGSLADRGWDIIDKVFDKYGARVSDAKGIRIWRPIKKLYHKAKIARSEAIINDDRGPSIMYDTRDSDPSHRAIVADITFSQVRTTQAVEAQEVDIQDMFQNPSSDFRFLQHIPMEQTNSEPRSADNQIETGLQTDPIDWVVWEQFLQETWDTEATNAMNTDSGNQLFGEW